MIEKGGPLWARGKQTEVGKRRDDAGEILFLAGFFMFCAKHIFGFSLMLTYNNTLDLALTVFSIALPVIKIVLLQRYTPKRIFFTAAAALPVVVSCLLGGYYTFLSGFIFILAMQDIDMDRVVRYSFRLKVILITVHVLWYAVLYAIDPSAIEFNYRVAGEPRHFFLLGHANLFMALLFWTCMEFVFLHYKKVNVLHMTAIWIINLVFYIFTDSNTGIVVLAVATILIAADKLGGRFFSKVITALARYTYAFCAVFFTALAMIYIRLGPIAKAAWLQFDAFFTGRLWFGAYVYDVYGVTWMGRRFTIPDTIFWDGRWFNSFPYFDNYYHGNLLMFGIIHLVFTAIAFIVLGKKLENREKIALILFSLYGIMEVYIVNVNICFVLLIIGKYLYKQEKQIE